jgi:hypothetical protein
LEPQVARVGELEQAVQKAQSTGKTRLSLALAGVQEQYLDYMAGRYGGIDGEAPDPREWASGLRDAEPAFFKNQTPATSTPTTTPQPPATPGPSAGTSGTTESPAPPISHDLIRQMTPKEYAARHDEIVDFIARERGHRR